MMVALVTVHKESPNSAPILCLVVPLVPKLLAHPINLCGLLTQWIITPKPHDAIVPKTGVIVKKKKSSDAFPFLPPRPSTRRPLHWPRFSPVPLGSGTAASWGTSNTHWHLTTTVVTWLSNSRKNN